MTTNKVYSVEPGLFALETPLGKENLTVYCYLILNGEEAVAIDAGVRLTSEAILVLLEEIGAPSLKLLALTHSHADHIGAAARLKSETGCLIAIERKGSLLLKNLDLRFQDFISAFPLQLPPTKLKRESWYRDANPPMDADILFQKGNFHFNFGALQIQAIYTGGHSWDSVSYYIPQKGWLFTGDAVGGDGIASLMPCYRDVKLYRSSLKSIRSLNFQKLLPGHFQPMEKQDADQFLMLSLESIDRVSSDILDILQSTRQPLDLASISQKLSERAGKAYSLQTLFTTLAHLDLLQSKNLVRKYGVEGALYSV